jgi:hypothetical protein
MRQGEIMKKYVYAKDKEGYAVKITQDSLTDDLIVISKDKYDEIAGTKERLILSSRGGKRIGAGRKRIPNRTTITKQINTATIGKIKDYSKRYKITENEALDKLINAGYEKLKRSEVVL